MANSQLFSLLFVFFTLFSTSYSIPPFSQPVLHAVETLSVSGFASMALTLQQAVIPESSSTTIFAPSDHAFLRSGQPSVSLLQYHFSPLRYKPENLKFLHFGTKIPTLFQNHSLMVTNPSYGGKISLNNVDVKEVPIYDDGVLIIYAVDRFFDPSFEVSPFSPSSGSVSYDSQESGAVSSDKPSDVFKSRGSSAMGSGSFNFKGSDGNSFDKPSDKFRSRGSSATESGSYLFKGSGANFFDKPSDLWISEVYPATGSESCMPLALYDFQESGANFFQKAADQLRSGRYSLMATFLDLQLIDVQNQTKITVFAPSDDVLIQHLANTTQFVLFLRRHVLPCKLSWSDLVLLSDGTELQTFSDGYRIHVIRSGDILVVNGIPVVFPDMYSGESLVVHGLHHVID